ncbi:hypothetical protein [Eggerthia catenaformis]
MKNILKIMMVALMVTTLAACSKSDAQKSYDSAVEQYQKREKALDNQVSELNKIIDKGGEPLYQEDLDNALTAVKEVEKERYKIPEMAKEDAEIEKQAKEIESVNYDKTITNLKKLGKSLEDSRKKYKLVTNPKEDYIIKKISTVEHVNIVRAVTEDNDPNGKLNKAGGYTATVYFYSDYVSESKLLEKKTEVIENGTAGGGSIEVYASVENANKRNEYLASFDGSALSTGSHSVFGTCVVRISDKMTATQQKELTKALVDALTKLN